MTFFLTGAVFRADIDDYWEQATYADADTYFTARGIATWTGDNDVKSQALQRAWDYMRTLSWIDDVFLLTQPDDITNAQILLALEELIDSGVLSPAITKDDHLIEKNIANVIIKKYTSRAPAWKRFRGVEMLLSPYLMSGNQVVRS